VSENNPPTRLPHPTPPFPLPPTNAQTNAHLLATCYYRNSQAHRAYAVLRTSNAPQCRQGCTHSRVSDWLHGQEQQEEEEEG
jgi:hypothetical protein